MDLSDDLDLDTTTPLELSPPPNRKLKRLKKSNPAPSSPQTINPVNSSPPQLQSPHINSSPPLENTDHSSPRSTEFHHTPPQLSPSSPVNSESLGESEESVAEESGEPFLDLGNEEGELSNGVGNLGAKRALEFDDEDGDYVENEQGGDDAEEMSGTERKKKKDKGGDDDGFDDIPERMTQKERRARFEELRAENQRILRESSNAAFKPAPLVQKPISSVLEKIRQRKLEILKKFISASEPVADLDEFVSVRELDVDSDPEDLVVEKDSKHEEVGSEENAVQHVSKKTSLDVYGNDGSNEAADQLTCGNSSSHTTLGDEKKPTFRQPINDTQDLFTQLPTNDTNDELSDEQPSSPLEEHFAPSVLAMNLKLDSAPPDELSDEEDNDKENIEPASNDLADLSSSPGGDPVKAFMEEEAEEEDDSDNDLNRFQDEEEEDDEDAEELNAMIATDYKERPVDAEMRNELHQKWLEQQDAAGTENLFQRLKYGSVLKETGLLSEEEDENGEQDRDSEHDSDDDASENLAPKTIVKMNMKKAKQMIPQMFSDKDDMYISSDDEETEEKLAAERLTRNDESKATLVSPAEDENSKEFFGRIKKSNDMLDTKKKSKASAFLDTLLTLKNKNSSSKSSFLGRGSNASLPFLQRRKSNKARSFIFERDDSNSRNAAFVTEGPSEMVQRATQSKKNAASKVSYSQSTNKSQMRKAPTETETRTSLFDILQRSSMCSENSNIDNRSNDTQTQSIFMAFKLDKTIKNERRA